MASGVTTNFRSIYGRLVNLASAERIDVILRTNDTSPKRKQTKYHHSWDSARTARKNHDIIWWQAAQGRKFVYTKKNEAETVAKTWATGVNRFLANHLNALYQIAKDTIAPLMLSTMTGHIEAEMTDKGPMAPVKEQYAKYKEWRGYGDKILQLTGQLLSSLRADVDRVKVTEKAGKIIR